MFFESWEGVFRTIVVGVLAYLALVLILRVSGKRTLSKWNAFDFIVTIAMGSALATVLTSKQTPLSEGIVALSLLIFMQFMITWLSVRVGFIRRGIKAVPTLLLAHGNFIHEAMRKERVTESEIRAAVRANGIGVMEEVEAVVLETDGSFSVIKKSEDKEKTALQDVHNFERFGRAGQNNK